MNKKKFMVDFLSLEESTDVKMEALLVKDRAIFKLWFVPPKPRSVNLAASHCRSPLWALGEKPVQTTIHISVEGFYGNSSSPILSMTNLLE
jgi:hypothetical protein